MDEPLSVDVAVGDGVAPAADPARLAAAVRHVLRAEGVAEAEVSLALLDDAAMAALNREYLAHEGPTDVISFALHDRGETPLGDVYLGAEQALRQAAELGVPAEEELLRLAVHGTLHVLGWDHPEEGEERAAAPMFARQEALLAGFLAGA